MTIDKNPFKIKPIFTFKKIDYHDVYGAVCDEKKNLCYFE